MYIFQIMSLAATSHVTMMTNRHFFLEILDVHICYKIILQTPIESEQSNNYNEEYDIVDVISSYFLSRGSKIKMNYIGIFCLFA